jgi:hypothetical protein
MEDSTQPRLTEEAAMTFSDYLLHVFYLIDTELAALNLGRLRKRGPRPVLHDSEVLTIEVAGELLGIGTDEGLYEHFVRYHRGEFPKLATIDRSTFARQEANLWRVKQLLHQRLLAHLPPVDDPVCILDSFCLHVCRFTRANKCRLFKGQASYGFDSAERHQFYGFRIHLRCSTQGLCLDVELAPADITDVKLTHEMLPDDSQVLADRNYWSPDDHQRLKRHGVQMLVPFRKRKYDKKPLLSRLMSRLRERIETVNGQLAVRFNAKHTWARDLWHLCSRLWRKVLSHTTAYLINFWQGNSPLQLDKLLSG